ncbi:MAG: hypothetical protein WCF90_03330, partial [Methanomicrobiales archaeon]
MNWSVAKPGYTEMYAHQPGFGTYITDATGQMLYYFIRSAADAITCTDYFAVTWPQFSSGSRVVPSLMKSADLLGGKRPYGMMPSFYKDRSLYYFCRNSKSGDVKGQGINNSWYMANITGFASLTGGTTAINNGGIIGGTTTVSNGALTSTGVLSEGLLLTNGTATFNGGTVNRTGNNSAIVVNNGTLTSQNTTINGAIGATGNTPTVYISGGSVSLSNNTLTLGNGSRYLL